MKSFKLVYRAFTEFLKGKVPGFTAEGPDGKLTVMIDEDLTESETTHILRHELSHIVLGHFDDDRTKDKQSYLENLMEIENEANQYADRMTDKEFADLMQYAI